MSYSGDININNSFEITLRNNTTKVQEFSMFELGSEQGNPIQLTDDIIVGTPNIFFNFYDFNDVKTWLINQRTKEPYLNGWTFDFKIGVPFATPPLKTQNIVGGNQTMSEIQDAINKFLELDPELFYIRISLQAFIDRGETISTDRVNIQFTYLERDPITGSTTGFFTGDPSDSLNPMLIDSIGFENFVGSGVPPPNTGMPSINAFPPTRTQTTSSGAISVIATSGTPYNQILESQTGQVLDIKSMRVDALPSVPSTGGLQFFLDAQLLVPLEFTKLDANDNKLVYKKIPTIDPYQFQKSVDFIDMKTKADTFALDGTTRFTSKVQPYTSMRLSFEYTQITNLIADTTYAKEQEEKQGQIIAERREEGDSRRTYKADIPIKVVEEIEKENKEFNDLEKKKTKLQIHLLYPKTNFWRLVA